MKKCNRCNIEQDTTEYYKQKTGVDGTCRSCRSKMAKEKYANMKKLIDTVKSVIPSLVQPQQIQYNYDNSSEDVYQCKTCNQLHDIKVEGISNTHYPVQWGYLPLRHNFN